MAEKSNVVLIGMPGSGKSTLGIVLAKILNKDFIDADIVIQNQCDKTLQKIIDAMGPEGFIQVENQILGDLKAENSIVATGGSAVYSDEAQNVSLAHVPPAQAALFLSLESVFGVVFSVILYGEQLTPRLLLGFALIFCAIVISETFPLKKSGKGDGNGSGASA